MYVIKQRHDLASRWTEINPVLRKAELGYESDTGYFKIGDGGTLWSDLPYFVPGGGSGDGGSLLQHINSPLPHPIYDDGPSLLLLYENAKV